MPNLPHALWDWTYDKIRIGELTGLSDDALHIHAGLLILIATAIVVRRWPWHWLPWLAVLVAETANEAYDMVQPYYPADEGNLRASLHDFWLTLLWPTVILVAFPLFGRARSRRRARSAEQAPREGADMRSDIGPG